MCCVPAQNRIDNGFSFSHYSKGAIVANTLMKKITAAVIVVVVTHKVRQWASK